MLTHVPAGRRRARATRWVAPGRALRAALLGVVFLAGCADRSPEPAPVREDTGPLSAWFQGIVGSSDVEVANAQERLVQERMAECMAEQGFTYLPVDPAAGPVSMPQTPPGPAEGTREFAEQYGYGYVWGLENPPAITNADGVDPNVAILAAMTDAERAAYERALWGTANDPPALGEEPAPYDWRTAGCTGLAGHEHAPEHAAYLDPVMVTLQQEMALLDAAIDAEPAVLETAAAWSACMTEAGHPGIARPADAPSVVWNRVAEAIRPGQEASADAPGHPATIAPDDAARLAELECRIAVADLDCREETDHDAVRARVRDAVEQEFLDDHAAELEAWAEQYFVDDGASPAG